MAYAALRTWRAYRAVGRRAAHLSHYAFEEATELERLAARLNEHGFALQQTSALLFPKLAEVSVILDQPLVAAAFPWVLRRMLARPFKKR
ncbi:MAG TPA: hypothetical protein DCL72_10350, partial [Rhizobiales bacterium]|nr:hypothetical protein [Hyphomicrobiales bacterium]